MTREEAIADIRDNIKPVVGGKSLDMAIEALEQEPCGDAISREDALQALCKAVHKNDDTIPCLNQRVSCLWDKTKVQDYAEEILKLPPVIPAEKMGRWIEHFDESGKWYECDQCHTDWDSPVNYCPNCGSKM